MLKKLVFPLGISSLLVAHTITFDDALQETLKNNNELKAKKTTIEMAKADYIRAASYSMGNLKLGWQVARSNNNMVVIGMKSEMRILNQQNNGDDMNYPPPYTEFKTNFVYQVPIFTGYMLTYAKEMAKLQVYATKYKFQRDKKKIAIEVLKAYNGAVAAKEGLKALRKAKKTTTSFIKMTTDFYRQGIVTRADVLQAKSRDSEVNSKLIDTKNKFQLAIAYLRFLTGDNTITDVSNFKVIRTIGDLKTLKQKAFENRSDLKWMNKNVETMKAKVKFDSADFYPKGGGQAEFGWANGNIDVYKDDKDYWTIATRFEYTIFDAGARMAKKQKAIAQAKQVIYYQRHMKEGIKLDVTQKYLNLKSKTAIIAEKIRNLRFAQDVLNQYTAMYKNGLINISILLLKEAELEKARAELVKAKYDQTIAAADLKLAVGDFLTGEDK